MLVYILPVMTAMPMAPAARRSFGERCCSSDVLSPLTDAQTESMTAVLKALADPVRLQIVDVLRRRAGQVCVCDLETLFDVSQPTLSHHLRKLRDAGLVGVQRRGQWAYYYVLPDALKELTSWLS